MKKILVSLSMGMSVRNLVYLGFIDELAKNYHVILATPFLEDQLKPLIKSENVTYVKLWVPRVKSRLSTRFLRLSYVAFWQKEKPVQLIKHLQRMKQNEPLQYCILSILAWVYLFIRGRSSFDLVRDICLRVSLKKRFGNIDGMFLASTDQNIDQVYAYSAAREKIPVYNLVHSWDNLTSRGFLATKEMQLLVWNEKMKREAFIHHHIPSMNVSVVGIPQYELYEKLSLSTSQNELRERLKIPSGKIITLCCSAERVFPDETLFIESLLKEVKLLPWDVTLVLRLHPEERQDDYKTRFNRPGIVISSPDMNFRARFASEIGSSDGIYEFALLMKHSDVVLNLASTTALDSVCMGTPALGIGFNMSHDVQPWKRAERHYRESSHYAEILKFNAIPVEENMPALVEDLRACLSNKTIFANEREELKKHFNPYDDALRRIVDAIRI